MYCETSIRRQIPASAIPRNHLAAYNPCRFTINPISVITVPNMLHQLVSMLVTTPESHTPREQENREPYRRPDELKHDVGRHLKQTVRREEERHSSVVLQASEMEIFCQACDSRIAADVGDRSITFFFGVHLAIVTYMFDLSMKATRYSTASRGTSR